MIDSEYLTFARHAGKQPIQLYRAPEILPERLLEDDPAARRQAHRVQGADRDWEDSRWKGKVGGHRSVTRNASRDRRGITQVNALVMRCTEEEVSHPPINVVRFFIEPCGGVGAEMIVVPILTGRGDQLKAIS
jgi:hypothetical protein